MAYSNKNLAPARNVPVYVGKFIMLPTIISTTIFHWEVVSSVRSGAGGTVLHDRIKIVHAVVMMSSAKRAPLA